MTLKRFETFVIVAIIGVIGVVYALMQRPPVKVTTTTPDNQSAQTGEQLESQQSVQQVATSQIKYNGEEGKNALELLKASHRVEVKEYSGLGEFVTAIDGLEVDSKTNFWAFYVNGKQSPVGAGQYVTHNDDVLEWKIESIDKY